MTFNEWYESIGRATKCSPRDLARAAFVAGRVTMRDELADFFASKMESRLPPELTEDMEAKLQKAPKKALLSYHKGLLKAVVWEIADQQAGGS